MTHFTNPLILPIKWKCVKSSKSSKMLLALIALIRKQVTNTFLNILDDYIGVTVLFAGP